MTIEVVNGTVIGQIEFAYIFFTTGDDPKPITRIVWFQDDIAAIEWFKQAHPDHYETGAEMRRFYV